MQEAFVGPYVLVRPHRSKHLRIYTIKYRATTDMLAALFCIEASEHGIEEEWYIRCSDCLALKTYPTRDQALRWLGTHRIMKH